LKKWIFDIQFSFNNVIASFKWKLKRTKNSDKNIHVCLFNGLSLQYCYSVCKIWFLTLNLESFHFQFHHYVTPSRRIMFYFKTSDDCYFFSHHQLKSIILSIERVIVPACHCSFIQILALILSLLKIKFYKHWCIFRKCYFYLNRLIKNFNNVNFIMSKYCFLLKKVDIWHPAVGLRCIIPPRHLCQLKTPTIPLT
jgi:hypothetical protein